MELVAENKVSHTDFKDGDQVCHNNSRRGRTNLKTDHVDRLWRCCRPGSYTWDGCRGIKVNEGVMGNLEQYGIGEGVDWGRGDPNLFIRGDKRVGLQSLDILGVPLSDASKFQQETDTPRLED